MCEKNTNGSKTIAEHVEPLLRGEHNVKKIIVLTAKSTPPLMFDTL